MKIEVKRFARPWILGLAVAIFMPSGALAQPGPPPAVTVDQSPEFAAVRARFENMTREQVAAAGYQVAGECVSSPFGGMGFHALNFELHGKQFASGIPDPQNPPILLLDANQRVVGLEWEANKNAPQPTLFGQKVPLGPGHPGLEEDHYMLHAYFKPDNKVLFGTFDPELQCPANGAAVGQPAGTGGPPEAAGMPRTGAPVAVPLLIAGVLALLSVGAALRKLRKSKS